MAWPLARKVSAALLGILAGTVATTGFLACSRLLDVLSSLEQVRYGVEVSTIKRNVEDRAAPGVRLGQLGRVQDAIDRLKADDARIHAIEVFDAHGTILFDTDRGAVGGSVPPSWVDSAAESGNQPFSDRDGDGLVVGVPLADSLGMVEGGVALRYSGAGLLQALGPLPDGLERRAGAVLAVFALVAVAGSYLLFGGVRRRLAAMEAALAAGRPPVEGDGFEADFAAFAGALHRTADDLTAAAAEVERLDRMA